jgi:hypothetical protein
VATVVSLPGCGGQIEARPPALSSAPPRSPFSFTPRRASEIGLAGIAVLLGMADRPARAIIDKVRLLVDGHNFPPPKTPRFPRPSASPAARPSTPRACGTATRSSNGSTGICRPPVAAAKAGAERDQVRAPVSATAPASSPGCRHEALLLP